MAMTTTSYLVSNFITNETFAPGNITYDVDLDWEYSFTRRVKSLLTQPHKLIALALALVGILANILCLLAVSRIPGRVSTHFRLIISLASSDILICVSVLFYMLYKVLRPDHRFNLMSATTREISMCLFLIIKALNSTALNVSLLNLMGMALDHFLSIIKPLHYTTMGSRKNATFLIGGIWFLSLCLGFSDFFTGLFMMRHPDMINHSYCEKVWMTLYQDEFTIFVIAFICFFSMFYMYIRIYITIRASAQTHRKTSLQRIHYYQNNEMRRSKKALITSMIILGTFVVCWLPNCLFQITLIIQSQINPKAVRQLLNILHTADQYLYDLLLLNTICDPIIYTIRMREVQYGCKVIGTRIQMFLMCKKEEKSQASWDKVSYCYKRSFNGSDQEGLSFKELKQKTSV